MSISKLALACLALGAMALSLTPLSHAADSDAKPAKTKAAAKAKPKAKAKAAAKTVAVAAPHVPNEEADEPDTTGSATTDFNCELGNKITIYSNDTDVDHIALRWKKRLHRLNRVGTTTGAQRFENPLYGLIWIGIPAKGMLLDSKLNRQLANECKSADQEAKAPLVPATPSAMAPATAPQQKG